MRGAGSLGIPAVGDDGSMTEQSAWVRITQADPGHSTAYVQRFRDLAAQGFDLAGEARLVDAMLPRGARVLDARVADVLEAERADAPRRLRLVHLPALVGAQKSFQFLRVHVSGHSSTAPPRAGNRPRLPAVGPET